MARCKLGWTGRFGNQCARRGHWSAARRLSLTRGTVEAGTDRPCLLLCHDRPLSLPYVSSFVDPGRVGASLRIPIELRPYLGELCGHVSVYGEKQTDTSAGAE